MSWKEYRDFINKKVVRDICDQWLKDIKQNIKYQKEKTQQLKIEQLKQEATKKYGKTAWAEIEATKIKMEKERAEELKFMDKDRQKQVQVFYWCLTASALITYFFKLYK
jgi:hypothetical protein